MSAGFTRVRFGVHSLSRMIVLFGSGCPSRSLVVRPRCKQIQRTPFDSRVPCEWRGVYVAVLVNVVYMKGAFARMSRVHYLHKCVNRMINVGCGGVRQYPSFRARIPVRFSCDFLATVLHHQGHFVCAPSIECVNHDVRHGYGAERGGH